MLSARFLVNSGLSVIKFEEVKSYTRIFKCFFGGGGVGCPNSHVVQGSTFLQEDSNVNPYSSYLEYLVTPLCIITFLSDRILCLYFILYLIATVPGHIMMMSRKL